MPPIRCTETRALSAVLLALACPPAASSAQTLRPVSSATGTRADWSVPNDVTGVPSGRTIRPSTLFRRSDTIYVLGNTLPVKPLDGIGPRAAALLRSPGNPLPLPPTGLLFAYPKGVTDRAGTIHLFWGETSEPVIGRRFNLPPVNSIWHATLVRGRWTTPERVLSGTLLRWTADQGIPVVDDAGRIHLMVAASLDGLHDSSVHLRLAGRQWTRREIRPAGPYATMIPWHGDTLIAAFVAPDNAIHAGANNVMTARSTDGGLHWAPPRLVGSFGSHLATAPTLALDKRTVHLVWAQSLSGGNTIDVLRQRFSEDGGNTWQAAEDAPLLREGELSFSLAAADCGEVSALVESIATRDGATTVVSDEIRWRGTRAMRASLLPDYWLVASPRIIAAGNRFYAVGSTVTQRHDSPRAILTVREACADK